MLTMFDNGHNIIEKNNDIPVHHWKHELGNIFSNIVYYLSLQKDY